MRQEVVEFYQNLPKAEPEQFNKAFELYRKSPGSSSATVRVLNAGGYTKQNLQDLLYDLQKLHGIKESEKVKKLKRLEDIKVTVEPVDTDSDVTASGTGSIPENQDKQLFPKIREEYPFLKNPDCPDELKILVTDKITFFNNYKEGREKLQQIKEGTLSATKEEQAAIVKSTLENFRKNREINKELDHYNEKNEVLGEHPIFKKLAHQRLVDKMSKDECMKFIKNTPPYETKKKKAMESAKSEERKIELQEQLDTRMEILALVHKKLGINGK